VSPAYILDAVRTPMGRHGGALAGVRPDDLAAHALRALIGRVPEVAPEAVDCVTG
jgi:acetyl-CoA acetyltransferase